MTNRCFRHRKVGETKMSNNQQISSHEGIKENTYKNFSEKIASEQMRVVRGYAIISKGDVPKKVSDNTFIVPSQNGNGEYTITKKNKWKCTCPDYEKRLRDCKHIHAVKFYLEFNQKVRTENKGIVKERQNCPYCKSTHTVGFGKRKCKDTTKQKYRCNDCRRYFIEEKDFERYKGNGKVTTAILDLYFKGVSLRGVKDHLKQFYDLKLDHSNILRRIQKYSTIINDYVKTLKPELKDIWHHDEMKIQAGGKWKWLWNIMDEDTKFLITTQVSTKARSRDTRKFFASVKEQAQKEPEFLITDGRHSYKRAIKKEMPQTNHVLLTSITDKRQNNNNIERLNGTIRDRIQNMRGMQNIETAEIMTSAFRNYYNFIKPHSTIGGITPALKAGIGVEMEGNRWMRLLKKSF